MRLRPMLPLLIACLCGGCSWPFLHQQFSMKPQQMNDEWLDYLGYRGEQPFGPWLVTQEGEYAYRSVPGAAPVKLSLLGPRAYGDLDGDGHDDAAVLLGQDLGGSGRFITLAAVVTESGIPRYRAGVNLGDRIKVDTIRIEGGLIRVVMLGHGATDPQCCPTESMTRTFRLEGGLLAETR